LWAAAQGGNTQDCAALLDINADVNFKNADGDTPLLAACRRGHAETATLLLAHGANVNTPGNDSLAPIHVCAKRGDVQTLDALLEANTTTSLKTRDGSTALDIAKSKGHENIYSRLMRVRNALPQVVPQVPISGSGSSLARDANGELPSVKPRAHTLSPRLQPPADNEDNSIRRKQRSEQTATPLSSSSKPRNTSSTTNTYSIATPLSSSASTVVSEPEESGLRRLLDSEIVSRNIVEAKVNRNPHSQSHNTHHSC
jgi:hypothetical protein